MSGKGAVNCLDCIPGQFQDQQGNKSCVQCASGRQFNASVAVGISPLNCLACGNGKHQPKRGSTFCLPCLTGTFQNESGSSLCKDCPIGFSNGDTEKDNCTSCEPGTYQASVQKSTCQGMSIFVKHIDFWNLGNSYFFFFLCLCCLLFCLHLKIARQAFIPLKSVPSPSMPVMNAHKVGIQRRLG